MTQQQAFYFEQKYCIGCHTCQIACKDKHNLPVGQNFRKVFEICGGGFEVRGKAVIPKMYAFWMSISCNHCLDAACIKACPVKAIEKRQQDGIVVIHEELCIGCQKCAKSCPYGAIVPSKETKKVHKCDFCLDLLEIGKKPACVNACPVRALDCDDLEALRLRHENLTGHEGLPEPGITQPALVMLPHENNKSHETKT